MQTGRIAVLGSKQMCVLQELIMRRGLVYRPDIQVIANNCHLSLTEATELVNGENEVGREINRRVDDAVAHVPLSSKNRQIAYAQILFDDKIARRREQDLPLTDADALDILDFSRKQIQPGGVNVNIQNGDNIANIFDLSSLDPEALEKLINNVQSAIEKGTIIDAEFTELTSRNVSATLPGCSS